MLIIIHHFMKSFIHHCVSSAWQTLCKALEIGTQKWNCSVLSLMDETYTMNCWLGHCWRHALRMAEAHKKDGTIPGIPGRKEVTFELTWKLIRGQTREGVWRTLQAKVKFSNIIIQWNRAKTSRQEVAWD